VKRENVRIAIAQINCTVGDLEGNANKIIAFSHRAAGIGADIISFPELAICGYPPEDLLLKPQFISDNLEQLKRIARNTGDMVAVVGFVDRTKDGLYNAAAVIHGGRIAGVYHKMFLPNYGVFDEARYFRQGTAPRVFKYGGCIFGVTICEDIWYKNGPALSEAASGAGLIININASPYCRGKLSLRRRIVSSQAKATGAVISYNNLVGGQDELVFDGRSMIVLPGGKVAAMGGAFCEDFLVADVPVTVVAGKAARGVVNISMRNEPRRKAPLIHNKAAVMGEAEEVYNALMLGLRDYVNKNGFKKVVIGLSGGIDSALVAAIAVDALGCENVTGIAMPSRYTSAASKDDAARLAKNLGIALKEIPIDSLFSAYLAVLKPHFDELPQDITEENLQARIRGNIMMALSNKFGWLVLTTGGVTSLHTHDAGSVINHLDSGEYYNDVKVSSAICSDRLSGFAYSHFVTTSTTQVINGAKTFTGNMNAAENLNIGGPGYSVNFSSNVSVGDLLQAETATINELSVNSLKKAPGVVVLLYCDETQGVDVNDTTSETNSKAYLLAANNYSRIIVESEVYTYNLRNANDAPEIIVHLLIGFNEKTFTFRNIGTTDTNSGSKVNSTLKFSAVQNNAAWIVVSIDPDTADNDIGGRALSLRVYGVLP